VDVLPTFGENRPRFLKNLSKLTFEYPHEGPCVVTVLQHSTSSTWPLQKELFAPGLLKRKETVRLGCLQYREFSI
jgi:hypothetical protein